MDIKPEIDKIVERINFEVKSRGIRGANELRNASLTILRGQRSGRVYLKPGTYGQAMSKQTKELLKYYRENYTGGQLYRASAPGEPPAVRTGTLRRSWRPISSAEKIDSGSVVRPAIVTNIKYAPWLDGGTTGMKQRPFKDQIIARAMPRIKKIFSEPYLR